MSATRRLSNVTRISLVCGAMLMPYARTWSAPVRYTDDFRCLSSSDSKPINLELRLISDARTNWRGGYVRYARAEIVIPITLLSSEVVEEHEGRPSEIKESWGEIVDGKIAGEYVFSYQGANIERFAYLNRASRKRHTFVQNNDAVIAGGERCDWQ